jgi:hypothetical protein
VDLLSLQTNSDHFKGFVMRTRNVLGAAVFAITTAFLVAPSAMADVYSAIGIDDRGDLTPGQEVRVAASCQTPEFTRSRVLSTALDSPDLVRGPGEQAHSVLFAMARIKTGLKSGSYSLSFTCNGKTVVGKFDVVGDKPKTQPKPTTQVPVKPKGSANTGGDDPVQVVAPEEISEPEPTPVAAAAPAQAESNTGALVLGGAGVLALGGTAALGYRRFRRQG